MRKTRIGALVAASALASASVVGGAGIANASSESLENLLPGGDPGVTLSITDSGTDDGDTTVEGQVGHDLDDATLNCTVTVADADEVRAAEQSYPENQDYNLDGEEADAITGLTSATPQNWDVTVTETDPTYEAAAGVQCDDGNDNEYVAFAYADGGQGSLDPASLDVGDSLEDIFDS